jgi:beta-lactamase regulating signal transducer with metallopeptidase domain
MDPVETLNAWSGVWSRWAMAGVVEGTILFALVGLMLSLGGRRIPAATAHWMLLLVVVKCAVPIGVPLPVSLGGWTSIDAFEMESTPVDAIQRTSQRPHQSEASAEAATIVEPQHGQAIVAVPPTTPARHEGEVNAVESRLSWTAWGMLSWAAVAGLLLLQLVRSHLRLRRALQSAERFDLARGGIDLSELSCRLSISPPVRVLVGPDDTTPAVTGILRPTLILPRRLEKDLTPDQLSWVVLHELAHVRRGDLLAVAFQRVLQIAVFFNPLAWAAGWLAEHQRECACDDLALSHSGCERTTCGDAFLAVLDRLRSVPSPALSISSAHRLARRRLLRIIDARHQPATRLTPRAAVVLAATCCLALINATPRQSTAGTTVAEESKGTGIESVSASASVADAAALKEKAYEAWLREARDRIALEQASQIRSARIKFRLLHFNRYRMDPLQQRCELISRSQAEVHAALASIDLVNDPGALRKVRDYFLLGQLVRDQPSYREYLLTFEDDRFRLDQIGTESWVCDASCIVHHEPRQRQATVNRLGWFSIPGLPERVLILPPENASNLLWHRSPRVPILLGVERAMQSGDRLLLKDEVAETRKLGQEWIVNEEGTLRQVIVHDEGSETIQLGYRNYPGNVRLPKVTVDVHYRYSSPAKLDSLLDLSIWILDEAEFNQPIPPETFRTAVPANTAVWDRRKELKLRAAEEPVADVLTLFER